MTILSDLAVAEWQKDSVYEAVLVTEARDYSEITAPIISLGVSVKGEALHIPTPISPTELTIKITAFRATLARQITFENDSFLFRQGQRSLVIKADNTTLLLTEKENELLSALARAGKASLTKEDLLSSVWKYHPDTQTHTVESHIYALRQKIGEKADALIQSTPAGYSLVQSASRRRNRNI